MKISVYPEDVLFEYTKSLLQREYFVHPEKKYIKRFPQNIEFSSEFAEKWQNLISSSVKAYLGKLFLNKKFLTEKNGTIKSYSLADKEIWDDLDFTFTHRSAERLYEKMLENEVQTYKIFPGQHLIATVSDSLFISICLKNFEIYHFPWIVKNNANWLIKAVYITKASNWGSVIPKWAYLLENYKENEFPLRELLIEKLAAYLADASESLSSSHENNSRVEKNVKEVYNLFNKALTGWKEECPVGYEDEKYLDSIIASNKIIELYNHFINNLEFARQTRDSATEIFNAIME